MPWSWGNIQTKHRRPIESLVLDNNMAENLLKDAREFLALEDWCAPSIVSKAYHVFHGFFSLTIGTPNPVFPTEEVTFFTGRREREKVGSMAFMLISHLIIIP